MVLENVGSAVGTRKSIMFTIPAPNAVLFNRETKVSAEVIDFADGVIGDSGHGWLAGWLVGWVGLVGWLAGWLHLRECQTHFYKPKLA